MPTLLQTGVVQRATGWLEADLPVWEKEAVEADTAIEGAISAILAPLATKLIERGKEIVSQLAPIKGALAALWSEPDRPSSWDEQRLFTEGRKPLAATKEAVAAFLRSTNDVERAHPDPWIEARKRLRGDANVDLSDITGLLSDAP
jgi:hypothetical protein